MSLINKMLQDLDARGTPGGAALQAEIRPVARAERRMALPVVLVSALSAVALAVGGYSAWRYYQQRALPAPKPVVLAVPKAVPAPPKPVPPPVAAVSLPVVAAAVPPPEVPKPVKTVSKKPKAVVKKTAPEPPRNRLAAVRPAAPKASAPAAPARAESEYQRALGAISEGRIGDGMAALEQALRIDPRHEGARQTLVGLLIEARRLDDAMRHLQAALALDTRQPAMAMLLARLQIERGGNGIETLLRTLPAAAGKPDYHAFLGGALQRAERYHEAAEQYLAAVRGAPQNGVWLMGLGLALQGDHRNAEALDAFQRARATGNLSVELQSFVERKIGQLNR